MTIPIQDFILLLVLLPIIGAAVVLFFWIQHNENQAQAIKYASNMLRLAARELDEGSLTSAGCLGAADDLDKIV